MSLLQAPRSTLARSAERAWGELTNPDLKAHSIRTWMFGRALAAVDGRVIDDDALYCACLLHDYGLDRSTIGVDFTLKGADRARLAILEANLVGGTAVDLHREVAEAICQHATTTISPTDRTLLAYYVMAGSMADLTGLRRWEIGSNAIRYIYDHHPCREHFKKSFSALIWNEVRAVPHGRFALYAHLGFTLLLKIAPHT